jgi:hypothetical protein
VSRHPGRIFITSVVGGFLRKGMGYGTKQE